MDRQEIVAVGVARIEQVFAFRGTEIAFALLRPVRHQPERDVELAQDAPGFVEIQLAIRLVDDDVVGVIRPAAEDSVPLPPRC